VAYDDLVRTLGARLWKTPNETIGDHVDALVANVH
jgi:hypothetical protein